MCNKKEPKFVFMFGAGAEGQGQIGLPSGVDFKKTLTIAKDASVVGNKLLNSIKLSNSSSLAKNKSSILYQTIMDNKMVEYCEKDEVFKATDVLSELIVDPNDIITVLDYCNIKRKQNGDKNKVWRKFQKIYNEKFYLKISEDNDSIQCFLKNIGLYSYYDSLFNYLRKPDIYPSECASVLKIYYAALISILDGYIEFIGDRIDPKIEKLYNSWKNPKANITRAEVNTLITEMQNNALEIINSFSVDKMKQLYYSMIKSIDTNKVACITTNYTCLAQSIVGLPEDRFAYLHGKLGLFEDLKSKRVSTIDRLEECQDIFPYMLIPSGVKPIISPYQIEEFHKMIEWSKTAEYFIIIGYGINSDDEHINSILRERLQLKKKIIYFIYDGVNEDKLPTTEISKKRRERLEKEQKIINEKLHIDNTIKPYIDFKTTGEFGDVINEFARMYDDADSHAS